MIHPIFVKKSYLYLGIPPRINTSSAISKINLIVNTTAPTTVCFSVKIENIRVILVFINIITLSVIPMNPHEYKVGSIILAFKISNTSTILSVKPFII